MGQRYGTITFLSDYGLQDEFVGVVKSVLHQHAQDVTVIDLTHGIQPFDIRGGSLALVRAAEFLCPGVVLAVVDPGVGTDRRAIAVEVGDGESVLVGPDNGLLAPVVALVGGASRAVVLSAPTLPEGRGATFDGRDVFAPAAAALANGTDLYELGTPIDPAQLRPGVLPFSKEENGAIEADAIWIDRFGNVAFNVTAEQLQGWVSVMVQLPNDKVTARRVNGYADLKDNEVGVVIDSSGLASLVLYQASAASAYGLVAGDSVTLRRNLI